MSTSNKFIAVGTKLVIETIEKPKTEEKKSMLIIPSAKPWDHIQYAMVLSAGDGLTIKTKVGDIVLTRINAGAPVASARPDNSTDYTIRIIEEDDILARIEG